MVHVTLHCTVHLSLYHYLTELIDLYTFGGIQVVNLTGVLGSCIKLGYTYHNNIILGLQRNKNTIVVIKETSDYETNKTTKHRKLTLMHN